MRKFAVALLTTSALTISIGGASAANSYGSPSSGVLPGMPSLYSGTPFWNGWGGIYVGANIGWAFGNFSANATSGSLTADLGSVNASGVAGGGQVGAQMEVNHFVLGVEADFQGSSQDHSDTYNFFGTPVSVSASMPWFATVRGRLGYAVDNVLLYGTGGLAIVDGKLSASALGVTASIEKSHLGWTAGGGVEWAFARQWAAKVEYLYMDSGNIELANVAGIKLNGRIKDNIVRFGLNYFIYN